MEGCEIAWNLIADVRVVTHMKAPTRRYVTRVFTYRQQYRRVNPLSDVLSLLSLSISPVISLTFTYENSHFGLCGAFSISFIVSVIFIWLKF